MPRKREFVHEGILKVGRHCAPFFLREKERMEVTIAKRKRVPTKKGRHLTPAEKAEAISLWKLGDVTIEQLSEKFGKDRSTFLRLFNDAGVAKGEMAKAHAEKIAEKIEKDSVDDAAVLAERIRETKENSYKLAKAIERKIAAEMIDAQAKKLPISSKLMDFKALKEASQALRVTREERYAVLGILDGEKDTEDDIPELQIKELSKQEIEEIQRHALEEANNDEDLDIPDVDLDENSDEPIDPDVDPLDPPTT